MPLMEGKAEMPCLGFCLVINSCGDLLPMLLSICVLQRYCANSAFKDYLVLLFSCAYERIFFGFAIESLNTSI